MKKDWFIRYRYPGRQWQQTSMMNDIEACPEFVSKKILGYEARLFRMVNGDVQECGQEVGAKS